MSGRREKGIFRQFFNGNVDERLSEIEAKSYYYKFKLYDKEGIEISKGERYKFRGKSS
ncbi:hypothetical protein AAHH67_20345 [Niallia circulans]|jgi:hypothetical protein